MTKGKGLKFKKDAPLYDGDPALLQECQGRARDALYGRTGDEKQIATAMRWRNGLFSAACDSARSLSHAQLLIHDEKTVEGVSGGQSCARKTATAEGLELLGRVSAEGQTSSRSRAARRRP